MATKKPKYNPDDVERWVTVRGARIPIMKDGSFGVGVKEDESKPQTNREWFYHLKKTGEIDKDAEYEDFIDYRPITDKAAIATIKRTTAMEIVNENDAYDREHKEGRYANTSKNARYDTSRATKKNGATAEDIARDKETFRKAREHEQKVAQRKATGRQMVASARDAIKKYGPKRGMWEDFNAADKVWTSISKAYSSGEISREDYEKAYNIFGARFFEMRKTRNRKK